MDIKHGRVQYISLIKIEWSPTAESDLYEILDDIA